LKGSIPAQVFHLFSHLFLIFSRLFHLRTGEKMRKEAVFCG